MSTEIKYFVERLTAPKPDWGLALVACKGVQPIPVGRDYAKVRRAGDYLVVTILGVDAPDTKDHLCDLETHIHIDEIVHVDFYSNLRRKPEQKQPETPDLITPTEDQINLAKGGKLARI